MDTTLGRIGRLVSYEFRCGLRGATVARLTPDQKVACSNHVGVNNVLALEKFESLQHTVTKRLPLHRCAPPGHRFAPPGHPRATML